MRLSEYRKDALYQAFSKPIMDLRIMSARAGGLGEQRLDALLLDLESRVWRRICEALNLEDELP